jgi:hypothetical protein
VVVAPPIGLFVPVLPPFYSTLWYRGVPYCYADDAYYVWDDAQRGYRVTEPPPEADKPASDDLFIYPRNGQCEAQQGTDRYECHSWAASETGFDPTQPSGHGNRDDYQRAMTACLEARGYSVR